MSGAVAGATKCRSRDRVGRKIVQVAAWGMCQNARTPRRLEFCMISSCAEYARFFRTNDIAPMELLDAHYIRHAFAPHMHEAFVIGVVSSGVERYRYRGGWHDATPGTVAVLNPYEVHTGEAATPDGWRYRVFYAPGELLQTVARQLTGKAVTVPVFNPRQSVLHDAVLARQLWGVHEALMRHPDAQVRESMLYPALASLLVRYMGVTVHEPALSCVASLDRVRQLLAERIADNVSLQSLADEVGLSP